MRVPVSWLREYVPLEMPLPELAERLSISTAEVEGIERRGVPDEDGNLGLFRVGRVLEAEKHPNADRLQLCRVDVGEGDARQIVCGAWNFGAGATVAVALPGARLPGGLQLEQRKVRGELSDGMILAEDEVELGSDHSGIMVLPEIEPGTPLGDVLPLVEEVLLVESTGNRPDLLSIYGLAREVAALYDLSLSAMPGGQSPGPVPDGQVEVQVDDFAGCPRYIGRVFRDVSLGQSPVWLRARLTNAGMRPISNVVDVTNYVMLALGNPLHAFDLAKLAGGRIVVRRAQPGETIRTLDGVDRKLEPDDLMIADAERSVALAGIMGGEETEISDETTEVLLEAANFEPTGIFRSSERLRLRTEGSNRWEKGVDPYLAEPAANLATQLLAETAGAVWAADADVHEGLPERPVIRYRPERADELIGLETPPAEQLGWLERLGFESRKDDVVVPTWRARDVTREVDVVEEVARARLDDVPFTLPARRAMFGALTRRAAAAPPDREPARRPRPDRDLHAVAAARRREPAGAPPARADLGRARRPAHEPAAEPRRGGPAQRRARRRATSRCSRSRASTSRPRTCPTRRRTSPRSSRAAGRGRRGSSTRSTRRSRPSRASSAPSTSCCTPASRRRPRPVWSASSTRPCWTASGARSSSTWRSCSRSRARRCATPTSSRSRRSTRISPSPWRRR